MTFCQDSWGEWAAGSTVRWADICSAQLVMSISNFQGHPSPGRFSCIKSALALEESKQTKITGFRQTDSLKNIEQIFGSEDYLQVWSLKVGAESLYGTWDSRTRRTKTSLLTKRRRELWDTSLAAKFRKEQTPRDFQAILFLLSFCLSSFLNESKEAVPGSIGPFDSPFWEQLSQNCFLGKQYPLLIPVLGLLFQSE